MQFYAIVNSNGVQETEVVQMLDIKEMQSLGGFPGEEAFVEAVSTATPISRSSSYVTKIS